MRLKSKVVMTMLLSLMLVLTYVGIKAKGSQDVIDEDIQTVEEVVPTSFLNKIDDKFNVDSNVMNTITTYLDNYFKSLCELELVDSSELFSDELYLSANNAAIKLMIETRLAYDEDFSLAKAHYDLRVSNYTKEKDKYYVTVFEDDYMNFSCLSDTESSVYDIKCDFVLDSEYKIVSFYKEQGHFIIFNDEGESLDKKTIDDKYNYYHDMLIKQITYNTSVLKPQALDNKYLPTQVYAKQYNRDNAVAYLNKYYHLRNNEWYNYEDEGGNCQNFASQALIAGGIEMDHEGEYLWKCYIVDPEYDPEIDDSNDKYGRTRSWINVQYFYDYAKYNDDGGLSSDVDCNIYYAEPGDIVQVGNGSLSHTTMVSKVIDGHILVSGNSIDMKDYPLEAFTYTNVCLIKILGTR